ncbi:MAG: FAD-dependent oxidoreductase, partial [Rhizobiaceae bacterium]|nr:FAD-dependent oxidoreductase [Rhizobiaceae bacterium]
MSTVLTPDICVIGAGSGGLSVAAGAAAFGVSVVLIEKGKMGGDCLNYGCVPSKAIIAAGKAAQSFRTSAKFGIAPVEPEVDFKAVNAHIRHVIGEIAPNDSEERFTALGVRVIRAAARFVDKRTVEAGGFTIKARRFVIATGSSAFVPPIPGLDQVPYLTNETLFDLVKRPAHLIIIGGGPIGLEMAQAHRRLGSDVTVIEGAKALGKDDPELAGIVLEKMRGEGIRIIEGAKVSSVEKRAKGIIRINAETADGAVAVDGSHLLVAAGRKANVDGLGLEAAGVKHDRRGVSVDKGLRASNRRVYAIGDVAGGLQFTHVAGYHAGLVIRSALFRLPVRNETRHIPWATYTDPELANVGMTETQAREANLSFQILRWPYAENDRAQAEGKTTGLIKVIVDTKGRILGAGIAGAGAGEMINIWALAVAKSMRVHDIAAYVPPYPTMAEIGRRAAVS